MPRINIVEKEAPSLETQFDNTLGVVVTYPYAITSEEPQEDTQIITVKELPFIDEKGDKVTEYKQPENSTYSPISTLTGPEKIAVINNLVQSGYRVYVLQIQVSDVALLETESTTEDNVYDILKDKNNYQIDFILSDYNFIDALKVAKDRGDCLAILCDEIVEDHHLMEYKSAQNIKNKVRSYCKVLDNEQELAKFGAFFGGCIQFKYKETKTATDYTTTKLPGAFAFLQALQVSTNFNPVWMSVAGVTRGKITSVPITNISSVEMEDWCGDNIGNGQNDTSQYCFNPIVNIRGYGDCIMGNNTLKKVDTTGKTATNYLSTRLLLNYLKKQLRYICLGLMFDSNDDVLFNTFRAKVSKILDEMKQSRAVQFYNIDKEITQQTNEIKPIITLKLYGSAEKFTITVKPENAESIESEKK